MNETPKLLKSIAFSQDLQPIVEPLFRSRRALIKAQEMQTIIRLDDVVKAAQDAARLMISEAESAAIRIREVAVETGYEEGFNQVVTELAKVRAERDALLQEA